MNRANRIWITNICAIGCLLGAARWIPTRVIYAQQASKPNDDGNVYVYASIDVDSNYNLYTDSYAGLDYFADPDIDLVYDEIQVEEDYGTFYDADASPDPSFSEYPPLKSNSPVATGHEYGVISVGWACYDEGDEDGDCEWYQEVSVPARVYVPPPPPPPPLDPCAVTSNPQAGFTSIVSTGSVGGSGILAVSFSGAAYGAVSPTVTYGPYSTPSSIAASMVALITRNYHRYGLTAKAFGTNIVYSGDLAIGIVSNVATGASFSTNTSSAEALAAENACDGAPQSTPSCATPVSFKELI